MLRQYGFLWEFKRPYKSDSIVLKGEIYLSNRQLQPINGGANQRNGLYGDICVWGFLRTGTASCVIQTCTCILNIYILFYIFTYVHIN